MGEVIQFPSGAPNRGPERGKREKRPDFLNKLTDTLFFLGALVESDPSSYSQANIAERKKALVTFTNDELMQAITSGNEFTWKEKPSWYHAVIEELGERGLLPG